jgi:mono/diheme cytochrome c family protein
MKTIRGLLHVAVIAIVLVGLVAGAFLSNALHAAPNGALLTGTVKSASGEKMGGVTISAKMEGQTITTSVFTDEEGNYYFPALDAGEYQVWAQADTFETARAAVELAATRHQDFSMKPMKDFERQLTGDQLLASLTEDTPEDRRLKRVFRNNCTSCHQPNYILQNRFDADGWIAIMNTMRDFTVTGNFNGDDSPAAPTIEYFKNDLAAYLAKERGPGPTAMKFNLRPRPKGDAASVVFTEYEVPLDPGSGSDTKYPTNNGSDWSLGTPSALNGSHGVHDACRLQRKYLVFEQRREQIYFRWQDQRRDGRGPVYQGARSPRQCRCGSRDRQGLARNSLVQYQHERHRPEYVGQARPYDGESRNLHDAERHDGGDPGCHEYGC